MSAINSRKQDSEEKYKKIFEESAEAIFIADAESGIILECNQAATELVDRTKDELIGQHQSILHPPEETENGFTKSYKEHMYQLTTLKKDGARLDTQVITKNGKTKDVSIRANLMYIGGKKIIYASFRDITQQKQAEEELRNSEEQFRSLAENSPNMIFINQNRRIVYVNQECVRVMGYSKEEFYSPDFNFLKLFLPGSENTIDKKIKRHMIGQDLSPYEFRLVTKNGAIVEAILNSRPVTFNGEPALLGIATDITERKKAERQISMQSQRLAAIFSASPEAITIVDTSGRCLDCNQAALNLFGLKSKEELTRKSLFELIATRDREKAQTIFESAIKKGLVKNIEVALLRADGTEFSAEVAGQLISDSAGKPLYFITVVQDITDRKKAEQEISMQKEKLAAIFASSPDAILILNKDPVVVDCNGKTEAMFLRPKEDLIGKDALAIMDEENAKVAFAGLAEILSTGEPNMREFTCIRRDGEKFPVEGTASLLKDKYGERSGFVIALRDVTDRKKAEEQILLLGNVAQQTVEGIAVSDNEGRIVFLNTAWLKMHKSVGPYEDLTGQLVVRFYNPEQLSLIDSKIGPEGTFRGRLKQVAEDGTTFTTMATLSPLRDKEGNIIGTIHTAKKLTDLVREIREVGSHTSKTIPNDGVA